MQNRTQGGAAAPRPSGYGSRSGANLRRTIADAIVSIGTATASLVHPREVFQPAIGLGACALLIGHNHPSGDVTPSPEDLEVTRRLADAGRILGVTVLDHIVWSRCGAFHSIREASPSILAVP